MAWDGKVETLLFEFPRSLSGGVCMWQSFCAYLHDCVLGVTVAVHLFYFFLLRFDEDIGTDSVYDTYCLNIERLLLY